MRAPLAIAVAALLAMAAVPAAAKAPACGGGRFLVARGVLAGGGSATGMAAISLDANGIAIDVGCRPVKPGMRRGKRSTKISAAWPACSGLLDRSGQPARVRLVKASIAAPACDTLTGTLVVSKANPKRRPFKAALSRCGDGFVDAQVGEQCEGNQACAPGDPCTSSCTCTTSVTTTTLVTSTTIPPGGFTCTEILGFSQSLMWHETPEFQQHITDARWQMRFRAGGDVDVWADPNADAWNPPVDAECLGSGLVTLCTPCAQDSDSPDRVIITITSHGYDTDVQMWAQRIRAAVATIRAKHPQVKQIVLQPVVGGPGHAVCPYPGAPQGVRASFNHPYIDQAIAIVVGDAPDIAAGYSPEVRTCADYQDDVGHLVPDARGPIGDVIGQFYDDTP
ncbi:MAG TPA: hypothetical protein VMS22_24315 [Candidatus Eisenbacteria bacterium]|nr:hypothetical protein [Candidatus Eisenbacteria bacterium]